MAVLTPMRLDQILIQNDGATDYSMIHFENSVSLLNGFIYGSAYYNDLADKSMHMKNL